MPQVKACRLDELQDGSIRKITIANRPIVLVRSADRVYAVIDRCPHMGAYLSDGKCSTTRNEIICPWHRYRFSLETGASVTNPELKVGMFPVSLENGDVLVSMP